MFLGDFFGIVSSFFLRDVNLGGDFHPFLYLLSSILFPLITLPPLFCLAVPIPAHPFYLLSNGMSIQNYLAPFFVGGSEAALLGLTFVDGFGYLLMHIYLVYCVSFTPASGIFPFALQLQNFEFSGGCSYM